MFNNCKSLYFFQDSWKLHDLQYIEHGWPPITCPSSCRMVKSLFSPPQSELVLWPALSNDMWQKWCYATYESKRQRPGRFTPTLLQWCCRYAREQRLTSKRLAKPVSQPSQCPSPQPTRLSNAASGVKSREINNQQNHKQ